MIPVLNAELAECCDDLDDTEYVPRPEPASIHAMLLDAEIRRASAVELAAMRDDARAQIRRCARLAGLALGDGNERLRQAMGHEAMAYGANVHRIDDEIARRA